MQPVKHFIIHHVHMSIAFVPVLLISCAKSHFLPIKRGLWSIFFNSYCCTKEANSGRYSSAQCCISFYLRYQSHKVTHNKLKSIECIWKFISCAAAKPERKKGFHGFVKRSAEKLWCGLHLKKKICTNHAKTSYFINCVYLRVPARQTCNKRRKLSLRSRSIL